MKENINEISNKVLELGELALDFSKINRMTLHQDGVRPESDTDHTFMLSIISNSIACKFYKDSLDLGLVSQFAILHDLVEVYAGDTDSLVNSSTEAKKIKEEKELESLLKLKDKFGYVFPCIHETIERYEAQDTKEARFVKIVDKILPKITSTLNNCVAIKKRKTKDEYRDFINAQVVQFEKYFVEFPELLDIFNHINGRSLEAFEE